MVSAVPSLEDSAERPCPNCGYDLRGATMDRCSECGMEFERASLSRSTIPWAHRGKIGWVRAYFSTAWLIAMGSARLRNELANSQRPRDSRWFRWITATLLGAAFVGVFVTAINLSKGYIELAIQPQDFWPPVVPMPGWQQELAAPWSAGATIKPVFPATLVAMAFALVAAPRTVLRRRRLKAYSDEHRRRALAMADYVCAPLLAVPPALGVGVLLAWLTHVPGVEDVAPFVIGGFLLIELVLAVAVAMTFIRLGQWTARATRRGFLMGCWAAVELLGLWILSAVMILGFLPWAVGFFWVVIDSFRS